MRQEAHITAEPFKRLFFALDCTAEQRRAINQWRKGLALNSGRPVPTDNFHLTLMFLGEVGVSQLPAVLDAAASIRSHSERLRVPLDRLDAWRRSNVLLLTPSEPLLPLQRLVYDLQQAMLALGFTPDTREYRPHLTLVRDYRDGVPEANAAPDFHLIARHFTLYESHKGRYLPLAQWPLVG